MSAEQPTVAVVIATRNRPEMVREAVAAVRAQEYDGIVRTVVVHDQSEPDLSLVDEDPRRPVDVVGNHRREGLPGARNTGIELAGTEFVAFCDDDDLWLPGKLAAQVRALVDQPDAVLATCGIRVQYDGEHHDRVLDLAQVPFDELLADRHTELHPSGFLLRRASLLGSTGLVDEDLPGGFGEDYELLLRCAREHPVVNIVKPLVVVRWGAQSFFFRRWETMAAGLTWMLERYPEFERVPHGSARLRGQIAFAHAAMGHRREALTWARGAIRRNAREPRAYLALAVASRAVSPHRVMEALHRRGRGI